MYIIDKYVITLTIENSIVSIGKQLYHSFKFRPICDVKVAGFNTACAKQFELF